MNRKSEGTQETEERGAKQRGPCSLVFFPWRFHVLSCQTGRLSVTGGGCRSIRIAVDGLLRNGGAPNAKPFLSVLTCPLCVGNLEAAEGLATEARRPHFARVSSARMESVDHWPLAINDTQADSRGEPLCGYRGAREFGFPVFPASTVESGPPNSRIVCRRGFPNRPFRGVFRDSCTASGPKSWRAISVGANG